MSTEKQTSLSHVDTWQGVAASLNIRIIKIIRVCPRWVLGMRVTHDCFNGSLIAVCLILRHLKRPHQVDFLPPRNSDILMDNLKDNHKDVQNPFCLMKICLLS